VNIVPVNPPLPHRSREDSPVLIVLHATAGATARSSVDHLRGVGNSYHFIIARDGRDSAHSDRSDNTDPIIFHCVPEAGHAFHASSTVPVPGRNGSINRNSIGVSLANIQNRSNPEPYTPKQIDAMFRLLRHLKDQVPSLRMLTTHAVVQPWNRGDPLGLNGQEIAAKIGLQWWQPADDIIRAHRPPRQRAA
jgi:N-acetyl-anhydromuramyl-L-alanine amidase AmpD